MTAPISNDLRERVVAAVLSGDSIGAVAARFELAASSVVKWSQRHRATCSVRPGKMGGYRKPILEPHRDFIAERLEQNPHLPLHGLKAEPTSRGIAVSHNTIWEFIRSERLRFKKTLFALEQAGANVARRRERWKTLQHHLDPERLVFIDEIWIKTNMTPIGGWGPKGKVCAARSLAHADIPRSIEEGSVGSTLRLRSADQQPVLFAPMSSSNWFLSLSPATSSSWTILAATNQRQSVRPSKPQVHGSGSCHPIRHTSIRSSRPSPR